MGKKKKIFLWLAGILLLLLTSFALLFPYFAPKILNSSSIKAGLEDLISRQLGGRVEFRHLTLSIFPLPHAVIQEGVWSLADVQGSVESLAVYPKLVPLLKARLEVSKVKLSAPELAVRLPAGILAVDLSTPPPTIEEIKTIIVAGIHAVAERFPAVNLEIHGGTLEVTEGRLPPLTFQNVDAETGIDARRVTVELTARSNLADVVRVNIDLKPRTLVGKGTLDLSKVQSRLLSDHVFPTGPLRVTEVMDRLTLSLSAAGMDDWLAEINGSLPRLSFQSETKKVELEGKSVDASLRATKKSIQASVKELSLEVPHLTLSGNLIREGAPPETRVNLQAREVDVASARVAALALAGDDPDVQEIAQVVRGGRLPFITVATRGKTLQALLERKNLIVRGEIQQGKIFVPDAELALEEVAGDFIVSKGMLEGRRVEARLDQVKATSGTLRIGLTGRGAPLHVEADVAANLPGVLALLKRFVQEPGFQRELRRVSHPQGELKGKLTIGDRVESASVKVDLPNVDVSIRYARLPWPLRISDGRIIYDGNRVSVEKIEGRLGKSSFSDLTAAVALGGEPMLKVQSGQASAELAEIYPWLSSFEALRRKLAPVTSAAGTVTLSKIQIQGALLSPDRWDFKTQGSLNDLVIHSPSFPGPLRTTSQFFSAGPQQLTIKNARVQVADARLDASQARFDFSQDSLKTDLAGRGSLGDQATSWLFESLELPRWLYPQTPISLGPSRLSWDKNGRLSYSGDLTVNRGPRISLTLSRTAQSLTIPRLVAEDSESHASLELRKLDRDLTVAFKGKLTHGTAEKIFIRSPLQKESVSGDFLAHINLEKPLTSTLRGHIEGKEFFFPYLFNVPVTVAGFSLDASGKEVVIKSTEVSWGDIDAIASGSVKTTRDTFVLDLDLEVDRLNWPAIRNTFLANANDKKDDEKKLLSDVPLRGTIRLKSTVFSLNETFALKPFSVDVALLQNRTDLTVTQAELCGVSFPGTVTITDQGLAMEFTPSAENQDLDSTLRCLGEKQRKASGKFQLKGNVTAKGRGETLLDSMRGDLELVAKDGRIYQYSILAKVLAVVNVTEIFRGKLPDITHEGFAYSTITAKGNLRGPKILLTEAVLDGSSADLVGRGEIDLLAQTLDLTIFVAPFKTLNFVTELTPIIKNILGGKLVAIPVKVTGTFGNPTVSKSSP